MRDGLLRGRGLSVEKHYRALDAVPPRDLQDSGAPGDLQGIDPEELNARGNDGNGLGGNEKERLRSQYAPGSIQFH